MTPNRTETNRANAQLSTGPKTAEGKQISSQNAVKHGLTAQSPVLASENYDDYQRHVAGFLADCRPQGSMEMNLVQSMADASWRLNRVAEIEATLLHDSVRYIDTLAKALSNLSMHSTRLSRQYERAVTLLRELQKTRREAKETKEQPIDPGFVFSALESLPAEIEPRLAGAVCRSVHSDAQVINGA